MYPNLKSAPINEAIVEMRVQIPGEIKSPEFEKFHETIKSEYPDKKAISTWQSSIEIKPDQPLPRTTATNLGVKGFLFFAADKKQAVQFRTDGFSFSRLKPYLGWEEFIGETRKLWEEYTKVAKPIILNRISVRNINLIEISEIKFDLDDYFYTMFRLPEKLEKQIEGTENFLVRLELGIENGIKALITQTVSPSSNHNPTVVPILFDIDVIMQGPLPLEGDFVFKSLEKLHGIKNDIFFNSITDKTLEMLK